MFSLGIYISRPAFTDNILGFSFYDFYLALTLFVHGSLVLFLLYNSDGFLRKRSVRFWDSIMYSVIENSNELSLETFLGFRLAR